MRKITPFIIGFLLPCILQAQSAKDTLRQECYLFDHFIDGKVLLTSGQIQELPLNYNAQNGSVAFEQNGQYMTVTNPGDVESVTIDSHTFVPIKGRFYEVAVRQPVDLLIAYECKPHPKTAIVDHNGTSRQNNDRVSNVVSEVYLNRRYKGDFEMIFQPHFWLRKSEHLYKANNEKQVLRVFPKKADAITAYIRDNKIDFQKPGDMEKLIRFCNS